MEIIIINKIEEKVKEYKKNNGVTIKWIYEKLGISKQRLYELYRANNFSLEMLIRISFILQCKPEDLYEYKIVEK